MSSKKWCIMFALSVILIVFGYALFNMLIDPFGVFGDPIIDWYSYNMTNNPRAAKIAYLDKNDNYKKYDSYMIGCSSTSSFSVEDLNHYLGGSFYNMIMYGADMLDVEQTCEYIIKEYDAKNIVVNIFLSNGTKYNLEEDPLTRSMHEKLNGESKLSFYGRYLFLNPQYSLAKLDALKNDSYLTKPFDVFNVETGAYDKKVRDVESIGTLESYCEAYPVFKDYPQETLEMNEIDTTVASIKRIKEICEENNVKLMFVMAPAYDEYVKYYSQEQVEEFYKKIVEVTEFWDFTTSSLTKEPRFFYDETHFRNSMGKMAIAKIADSKDTYYPEDIGVYVTLENVDEHLKAQREILDGNVFGEMTIKDYTKQIPIITYHSIVENPKSNSEISPETFEKQIKTLKDLGYTSVFFGDLIAYVENGIELPEKPICITFDDGYLNNYEVAYPILQKYKMKATIFAIGVSVGSLTNYKDTNYPITPHFTYEQAREMIVSGLISIQSHTYDMHQWAPYEVDEKGTRMDNIRENILKLETESEVEYREVLKSDIEKMNQEMNNNLYSDFYYDFSGDILKSAYENQIDNKLLDERNSMVALAYPSGKRDTLADVILKENGIKATVTIEEGINEIIKGLPQSLIGLKRFNMDESILIEDLEIKLKG